MISSVEQHVRHPHLSTDEPPRGMLSGVMKFIERVFTPTPHITREEVIKIAVGLEAELKNSGYDVTMTSADRTRCLYFWYYRSTSDEPICNVRFVDEGGGKYKIALSDAAPTPDGDGEYLAGDKDDLGKLLNIVFQKITYDIDKKRSLDGAINAARVG